MKEETINKSVEEIAQIARERIKNEAFHKTETGHAIDLTLTREIIIEALTSHTNTVLQGVVDIVDDECTWYNTNNQIPDSELGKSEEHWIMLQKLVRASLKDVGERIKKDVSSILNDQIISNEK